MIWIIILLMILSTVLLLFLAPFEIMVDMSVSVIKLHWTGIGNASVVYESDEWWLKIRIFFFYKKWAMMQLIFAKKKKKSKSSSEKEKNESHVIFKGCIHRKKFQGYQMENSY